MFDREGGGEFEREHEKRHLEKIQRVKKKKKKLESEAKCQRLKLLLKGK